MKRLLLIGLLLGCAGEVRTVARPSDRSDLIDPSAPSPQLRARQPARALESFERACAQGEPEGCLELARGRRDQLAGTVEPALIVEPFRKACAAGSLVACREGKLALPSAQAWFDTQACFHGEVASCGAASAGPAITMRTIALHQRLEGSGRSPQFVGPDGHSLLAFSSGVLELLDPTGRVPNRGISLASAKKRGPRRGHADLERTIARSIWRWDDRGGGLHGLFGTGGYGLAVDLGIAVWSPMTEALPVVVLPGNQYSFGALALSADRRFALIGSDDSRGQIGVHLLDLRTRRLNDLPFGSLRASSAEFTADSRHVALGFETGEIAIVTTDTGAASILNAFQAATEEASTEFGAMREGVKSLSFHPTRRVLVSNDHQGRVWLWHFDAPDRGPILLAESGRAAAFSSDGRYLALAQAKELVLLDATTLERVAKPVPFGGIESYAPMVFSPDSRYVAITGGPANGARGPLVVVFDLDPSAATSAIDSAWFAKLRPLPVPASPPSPRFDRDAAITGIVSVNGQPVAGAQIELRPSPHEWPDARALPPRFTRSGGDGHYAFKRVPAIDWVMTVISPDTKISSSDVLLRGGKANGQHPVALEPGVTLRGKVLDASGKAAPGARITLGDPRRPEITADREGRFVVRHLQRSGYFRFHARRADGAVATTEVLLDESIALPEIVIRLLSPTDPRILRLKVVDPSGNPVAKAGVQISGLGRDAGMTDARGTLVTDLPDDIRDQVTVSVWKEQGRRTSQSIALPQPGVVTLVVSPPLD